MITLPIGDKITVAIDSFSRLFLGANNDICRSLDDGVAWTKMMDNIFGCRHMSEAPNDDLCFNAYDSSAYTYKSTDKGRIFLHFPPVSKIVDYFRGRS